MTGHVAAGRPKHPAGFTLIELLVALAIVAALIAGTPSLMAGIPGFRLRAAAAGVADTLRRLRDDAIREGRPTSLAVRTLNADQPVEPGVLAPLPGIAFQASTQGLSAPDRLTRFRFFPDGSASGGTIRLVQGSRTATIRIDWLTGRVRVDD